MPRNVQQMILLYIILSLSAVNAYPQLKAKNNKVTIHGYIYSKEPLEPLAGASVLVYDKDSVLSKTAIADEKGFVSMELSDSIQKIIIQHVGYDPYSISNLPAHKKNISLDTCYLISNNILSETIITASLSSHDVSLDTYLVTNKMRSRASNTYELLDQIHGLRYEQLSNSIKIGNKGNILFLVNSIKQSKEYIINLNPERISKVEIDKSPKGRYISEGYDAVINIILNDKYEGYDINVSNFMISNISHNNGDHWLMTEQPSFNGVYTNQKVNIFANYGYGYSKWNSIVDKKVNYVGLMDMQSENFNRKPNDVYTYRGNVVNSGINYKLTEDQTLSLEIDYSHEVVNADNKLNFNVNDLKSNAQYYLANNTTNKTNSKTTNATLFYNGKISESLKLYCDLTYNNYNNDVSNILEVNSIPYSNYYSENKEVLGFNLDVKHRLSKKVILNWGYSGDFRKYSSPSEKYLFNYKKYRNKAFVYLHYAPVEKMGIELGVGGEKTYVKTASEKQGYFDLLPMVKLNYKISDDVNLKASYLTNMEYPTLAQLNYASTFVDTLMQQKGNPKLNSSISHLLSFEISFWNNLTFTPQFEYTPRAICDLITKDKTSFISTFYNINYKEYTFQATYNLPLGKFFNFDNSIMYYYSTANFEGQKKSMDGWLIDSEINFCSTNNLLLALGYHKGMERKNRIQGFQMYNFDSWTFSANKQLFKNKLSIMLTYLLPIKWGVENVQRKEIQTPYYTEVYNIGLDSYRNTLVLRLSYRFNSGKVISSKRKSSIEKDERIRRTFDF